MEKASNMSRDIPIEKIRVNTGFKLRFTSPSIEELPRLLERSPV